jgi:hypothetical protein
VSAGFASPEVSQAVTDLNAGPAKPILLTQPIWPLLAKSFTSIAAQPWVIEQPVRGGLPGLHLVGVGAKDQRHQSGLVDAAQ